MRASLLALAKVIYHFVVLYNNSIFVSQRKVTWLKTVRERLEPVWSEQFPTSIIFLFTFLGW